MSRGNKARRDAFISIPAETKQLLRHLIPAIQHMPKVDRIEGVGAEMKRAAWGILREYHMAYRCQESRIRHLEEMVGWYGVLVDALEIACLQGILADGFKLNIAMRLERIEEGIQKWHNSIRQERDQGTEPMGLWADSPGTDM